jgi:hypothetical protein
METSLRRWKLPWSVEIVVELPQVDSRGIMCCDHLWLNECCGFDVDDER